MLIKNVKLITPYEVMTGHAVIIKKGKIVDILPQESVISDEYDEIIDGKGYFLAPGFVDIHNHGNSFEKWSHFLFRDSDYIII